MDKNQVFKQSYDKNVKRKLSISDEKEELNEPKEKNKKELTDDELCKSLR